MAKKSVRYLMVIIIGILCCLLALSFSLEAMCVHTISNTKINSNASSIIVDAVFDYAKGVNNDQLLEYQRYIEDNDSLYDINKAYLNEAVNYIANNRELNIDVSKEYNIFLNDCVNKANSLFKLNLSTSMKKELIKKIKAKLDVDDIYSSFIKNMSNKVSTKEKIFMKIYQFGTSTLAKVMLGIYILIALFVEYKIHDSKNYFINDISKGLIIGSLFILALTFIINYNSDVITNALLGTSSNIYTSTIFNYALVLLIVGCIGTISTYLYMYKNWDKEYK